MKRHSKCSPSSKTLAKSGLEPDSYTNHTDQSQPLYRLSQILIFVLLLTLRLYNFEFVFTVVRLINHAFVVVVYWETSTGL